MTPKTKVGIGVGALATVLSVVTGLFTVDDRYMKDANADEIHHKTGIDRERGDIVTQIKILKLEIQYLSSIGEDRNPTEETQLMIAREQLKVLLARQAALNDL